MNYLEECHICDRIREVNSTSNTMANIHSIIKKYGMHILYTQLFAPFMLLKKVLSKLPVRVMIHILECLFICNNCYNRILFLCSSMSYAQLITLAGCSQFTANEEFSCTWRNTVDRLMLKNRDSGKYEEISAISLLRGASRGYANFAVRECEKYLTIHESSKRMTFIVINKVSDRDSIEMWSLVQFILMLKFPCTRIINKYVVRYHEGGPNSSYNKWSVKKYCGIGQLINVYVYIVHPTLIQLVPGRLLTNT